LKEPDIDTTEEQRRVSELVRSFDAPAPQSLHRAVELIVSAHPRQMRRGRLLAWRAPERRPRHAAAWLAGAGAIAVAAIAIASAAGSGGGSRPTLSLRAAAAPTLLAATLPAPPENRANHAQLAADVDGVTFPYWGERLGWRSTGERSDRIAGRAVTTVFYTNSAGRRVGYAILAGTPVPHPAGGVTAERGGVPYTLLSINDTPVVTWLRDGHLCVVSGKGVSSSTLLRLASWTGSGATAS
jgi:hypothetical protein